MKKTIYLFALAGLTLFACGDNLKATSDGPTHDTGTDTGSGSNTPPPPPALGAQIDRMGRPAINTALNNAFNPNGSAAGSAKDAYNQDMSVGTWQQTWVPKFAPNLAIIDSLDTGICGNGICEDSLPGTETSTCGDCMGANPVHGKDGCGNVPLWAPGSNGSAAPTSYVQLAGLLADDELYLDTSKTACAAYLALEFSAVTMIPISNCGGRAPSYDVIDTSYSVLAMGLAGFDPSTLAPLVHDDPSPACRGGSAATDPTCANHPPIGTSDTTFPFLAAPH
jgi:hypothetical protein